MCVHGLPSLHKHILVGNEKVVSNCAEFFAIYFFFLFNIVLLKKVKGIKRENAGMVCLYDVYLTANRN